MSQSIPNDLPRPCGTLFYKLDHYLPTYFKIHIPNPTKLISYLFLLQTTLRPPSLPSSAVYRAESSFHILQQWYNPTIGLYTTTGWWNNANLLTTLSNLASLSPSLSPEIQHILHTSFIQAPLQNSQSPPSFRKSINLETMLIETHLTEPLPNPNPTTKDQRTAKLEKGGFLNDYYDDEGWWALAWLQAYDLTSQQKYLDAAVEIFADMQKAENTTPCNGGIWWDRKRSYVNAIANELYLSVAAGLANRVAVYDSGGEKERYLEIAVRQWVWFEGSGMVNAEGTVNDGLKILEEGVCKGNGGTVWSYNQGVVLGGLVELFIATGDGIYIEKAVGIAKAAIVKLAAGEDGVLRDVCEVNRCGADGVQFKGVFLRGVMKLLGVLRDGKEKRRLERFVKVNAESIWGNDRNENGEMGVVWSGPVKEVTAGSHGSALDALVAHVFV